MPCCRRGLPPRQPAGQHCDSQPRRRLCQRRPLQLHPEQHLPGMVLLPLHGWAHHLQTHIADWQLLVCLWVGQAKSLFLNWKLGRPVHLWQFGHKVMQARYSMCRYMYIQTMDPSAHYNLTFDPLDPTKVSRCGNGVCIRNPALASHWCIGSAEQPDQCSCSNLLVLDGRTHQRRASHVGS